MSKRIIVIGAGPAGIMAALAAADEGATVELWERNKSIGRKLAITGKGRCNITNNCGINELIKNIPGNGSFLYSAFSRWDSEATISFFEHRCQLPLKTERGRRVFPASDSARDVVEALLKQIESSGVQLVCNRRAKRLSLNQGAVSGVYEYSGAFHPADAVIVATGGVSYPATGSTGDGYSLAEQAGHCIISPNAALVPLETAEDWPRQVSGLSLKNAELSLFQGEKLLDKAFGELLFTHFGVSGPIVLTLSRTVSTHLEQATAQQEPLRLRLDLKPALSAEQLDERLQRNMQKFIRKIYANSLSELLPSSLIPVFIQLSGIPADKAVNQISRAERQRIGQLLKNIDLTVAGLRPISEAIVTAGGVSTKEVDPKSMQSKLVSGLYFAGEVLDIDGYTGGYNLQAAWASGHAAGIAAAQ